MVFRRRVGVVDMRIYFPQLEHEQSEPQLPMKSSDVSDILFSHSSHTHDPDPDAAVRAFTRRGRSLTAGGT